MRARITFGNGCAISENMLYVASYLNEMEEDVEHTRMFVLNTEKPPYWFHHDIFGESIVSTCFRPETKATKRSCYSLSNTGFIEIFNSDGATEDTIFKPSTHFAQPGDMTKIKFIGDNAYACGSGNQVYKSTTHGWISISNSLQTLANRKLDEATREISRPSQSLKIEGGHLIKATKKLREYTILHSINGLAENSIYTCGSNGEIWHWDGVKWQNIKSGTKQHLHDIHCVSDDLVLVSGHNGTVLKGNHTSGFKRIPTGNTKINFWCIRLFRGVVYLGSSKGLFKISGDKIISCPITTGAPRFFSIQSIDVKDETMWVVADRFILRHHTSCWSLIEHPDNS